MWLGLPGEMVQRGAEALEAVVVLSCRSSVLDMCVPSPGLVQDKIYMYIYKIIYIL